MKLKASYKKQRFLMMLTGAAAIFFTGFVHVWSVFLPYVMDMTGWTQTQASFGFYLSSCIFVVGNILGGKWQIKYKSRTIAFWGGICFAAGVILSAFCLHGSPIWLYLSYGALQGIGQGMVYSIVLSTAQKWFPGRTGFASGVVVTANGLCAFFMAPISRYLLEKTGPETALLVVGIAIAVVCGLAFLCMTTPEKEWFTEDGQVLKKKKEKQSTYGMGEEYPSGKMIRTRKFYYMVLAMMCGLIPYYLLSPISQSMLQEQGIASGIAVGAVMAGSLLNAATRLLLPTLADKVGRIPCIRAVLAVSAAAMLMLTFGEGYPAVAAVVLMYVCFGGIMGNFPSLTSSVFGMKHFGENYGYVMIGMMVASMGTPLLNKFLLGCGYGLHAIFGIGAVLSFAALVFLRCLERSLKK